MVGRRLAIGGALGCALVAAGCFSPNIPEGYACGADDSCPPGQACDLDGVCRTPSGAGDPDGSSDPDTGEPVNHDEDGDGVDDGVDNCPGLANPDQSDDEDGGDGVGDACDPNPSEPGDVILFFESFAESDAIDDWESFSGQSSFIVNDDFLEQIDGTAGVAALGTQALTGSVGTVEVSAQLTASAIPFESAFGPAIGLDQMGNAANGHGCMLSTFTVPRLELIELERDAVEVIQSEPASDAVATELVRYRFTASSRANGIGLDCARFEDGAAVSLSKSNAGEHMGRFGVVTVDAAARFGYLIVYGRR